MRKLLACMIMVGVLMVPALAADVVTHVNPTGPVDSVIPHDPVIPTNGEPVCGVLDYDGVGAPAAGRRSDGSLDSWVLANCEFSGFTAVDGISWLTVDNTDGDWNGRDDWSIWDADTVENGCADDSNVIAGAWDVPNTREPVMDDNGNQVVLFGRNAWIYTVKFNTVTLQPGKYYLAARAVLNGGQSFMMTRPCNGDKPMYFQSGTFGFPCAVPGRAVFGVDYCVAIAPLGESPPPEPTCIYQVTKVKAKTGACGEPCAECAYAPRDLLCTVPCDLDAPNCEGRLRGFNACADGGACKVKANYVGCDLPPDGCTRCE